MEEKKEYGIGYRHLIAVLLFTGLTISYGMRVDLSVSIVAMTDHNSTLEFETFDWDKPEQQLILSSFFWGYVITQVPGAYAGNFFGPHYPLGIAILICSLACLVTPFAAPYGHYAVIGVRIVQGLSQGFLFPSLHNLCSKWVPQSERGRLVTFVYAGAQFGTVLSLIISGFLAGTAKLGWPSVFYAHGAVGVIWSVLWMFFGSNKPSEHKTISLEELKYIESSMGSGVISKKLPTPWSKLVTSLPMWALVIAHCSNNWGFWTLLTEMPTYMKEVLNYDIKKSGWTASLPYLTMWILSFVFSWSSDKLVNRGIFSVGVSRKVFNSIGIWVPAAALVGLSLFVSTEDTDLALVFLIIAVGFNSATYVGFQVNHIDLAPNHAGIMMGITNGLANIMSIIAPLVVGLIISEGQSTASEWRAVFYISAGIYFVGNLVFIIFGQAELQPWNGDLSEGADHIETGRKPSNVYVVSNDLEKRKT